MQILSDIVTAIMPSARLIVLSLRGDSAEVVTSGGEDAPPAGAKFRSAMVAPVARHLLDRESYTLDAGQPDLSPDIRPILKHADLRHAYVGLLCATEEAIECVVIDMPGRDTPFTDTELKVVDGAVRQTRSSRENDVLRAQAARRQRLLEAIARLGIVFTSVLDLRQAAGQVVEYASLLLKVPAFLLLHRAEGAPHFTVLGSEGIPHEVARFAATPIEVSGLDVKRPGQLAVKPIPPSDPTTLLGFLLEKGFTHTLVAPLVVEDDRLRGVLLGVDRQEIRLDDEEHDAFHLLSLQATTAVWNAERYEAEVRTREEARQELDTTSMLLRAADLLARSLDTDTVIRGVMALAREATGIDSVALSLIDEATGELVFQAGESLQLEPGSRLPVSVWPAELADSFEQRRSIFIDKGLTPGHTPSNWLPQSSLSVPLIFKGKAVGNIGVLGEASQRLGGRVVRRLEGIAAQAAVAIENARLYQQESSVAEMLQQSLLTLPDDVPGTRFANAYYAASTAGHVGGDFYDLFEIEHDRVGVIAGDISGKGLEAAVLTSLLKNTLRAHTAERHKTPGEILRLTNEIVYLATNSEQFATVFFGILDRRSGRLDYANAGHTTGALLREDGSATRLESTGPLVGAFKGMEFGEGHLVLQPGDTVFLYTDGLTEARRGKEEFGEQRVFDLLSAAAIREPKELIQLVITEVERFTEGVLRDDLALMAVRFTPGAAASDGASVASRIGTQRQDRLGA